MSFASVREKAGLTQKELATAMGVDQSAVSFWETGKTKPRASMLMKLAEFYGCAISDLLQTDEQKTD